MVMAGKTSIGSKTFSIRFFLNTRLKGFEEDGIQRFPVYAQVNYNRRNSQMPVVVDQDTDGKLYLPESSFNLFEEKIQEEINGDHLKEITIKTDELSIIASLVFKCFYAPVVNIMQLYHSSPYFEPGSIKHILYSLTEPIYNRLYEILNTLLKNTDIPQRAYRHHPNIFFLKRKGIIIEDQATPWFNLRGTELFESLKKTKYKNRISQDAKTIYDCMVLLELLDLKDLTILDWLINHPGKKAFYEKAAKFVEEKDGNKMFNDFAIANISPRISCVHFGQKPIIYFQTIESVVLAVKENALKPS
jgi:hypothetical protein